MFIFYWPLQLSLQKDQGDVSFHKSEEYLVIEVSFIRPESDPDVTTEVLEQVTAVCRDIVIPHTQRKIIKETEAYSLKFDIKD